jgi:hypothetical protein
VTDHSHRPVQPLAKALQEASTRGAVPKEIHYGQLWGTVGCPVCGDLWWLSRSPGSPDRQIRWLRAFLARHAGHLQAHPPEADLATPRAPLDGP